MQNNNLMLLTVSIHILPCASAAHECYFLLTTVVMNLLITTKAFTLYISYPVATGYMEDPEAGKY
jgi:hypothetical protein